ncbi:MAG: acetylxylan esterase, partial [Verrucomicrobiaceae bacterium]
MKWKPILPLLALMMNAATAAEPPANYDEAKIPPIVLPELLKNGNGTPVKTAADWTGKRRPELLTLFEKQMFGRAPTRPALAFEVQEEAVPALNGKALRKQIKVFFTGKKEGPGMNLLIYTPASASAQSPVPFFLGLNFEGNPSVCEDPQILPRMEPAAGQLANGQPAPAAKPAEPGSQTSRWQVEWLVSQGFGTATAWYWDIDPDYDDGFKNGVHALYPDLEKSRTGESWGSLAAWAWGLRLGMDYLEKEPLCDAKHVALHGHSRLGKSALWAGANDERFSLVISNESGCGGAA